MTTMYGGQGGREYAVHGTVDITLRNSREHEVRTCENESRQE